MTDRLPKPKMVGFFSGKADHGYREWLTMARYFTLETEAQLPIDISVRLDQIPNYRMDFENLSLWSYLLKKIELIRDMAGTSLDKVGFVASRQELMKLWSVLTKPGQPVLGQVDVPVRLSAVLFKGVIYLYCEDEDFFSFSQIFSNFYHSLVSETPDGNPDPSTTFKENFNGVFKLQLEKNSILYKSVIHGVLANTSDKKSPINDDDEASVLKELQNRGLVELKLWKKERDLYCAVAQYPWLQGFFNQVSNIKIGVFENYKIIDIKEFTLETFLNFQEGLEAKTKKYFNDVDRFFEVVKSSFAAKISREYPEKNFNDLPIISLRFKSSLNKFYLNEDVSETSLPEWFINEVNKML